MVLNQIHVRADSDALERDAERLVAAYERRKSRVPQCRYSFLNVGNLLNVQECERAILAGLRRHGVDLARAQICEIGCGAGYWLREFVRFGFQPENIVGIDLLPDRIAEARRLCPAETRLSTGNAAATGHEAETFDVVAQFTVFSSVRDTGIRRRIADEMMRLCRPNGVILWYDFFVDNPRNRDVVGIRRHEIESLFAPYRVHLRRLTLAPPLARMLGKRSAALVRCVAALKIFSTHYLGVIEKNAATVVPIRRRAQDQS
jgi:SAM-dependent methyltransferase